MQGFEAQNATLVAISVDPPEINADLARKLGVTFPLLSDTSREVTKAYGLHDPPNDIAWPAIYIVDPGGTVTWRSLAEDYKVRPAAEVILEQLAVTDVAGRPSRTSRKAL